MKDTARLAENYRTLLQGDTARMLDLTLQLLSLPSGIPTASMVFHLLRCVPCATVTPNTLEASFQSTIALDWQPMEISHKALPGIIAVCTS